MFIRIKIEITSTGYLPYFLMQKYKITGKEKKVYQNNDTPSVCLPAGRLSVAGECAVIG